MARRALAGCAQPRRAQPDHGSADGSLQSERLRRYRAGQRRRIHQQYRFRDHRGRSDPLQHDARKRGARARPLGGAEERRGASHRAPAAVRLGAQRGMRAQSRVRHPDAVHRRRQSGVPRRIQWRSRRVLSVDDGAGLQLAEEESQSRRISYRLLGARADAGTNTVTHADANPVTHAGADTNANTNTDADADTNADADADADAATNADTANTAAAT